jgi:predicted O-methyltransferase YrrM
MLLAFLKYLFLSKTRHGTHSPFAYQLVENVIYKKEHLSNFNAIEKLRKNLLKNGTSINITDLGAGSRKNNHSIRSIASITRSAVKSKKYSQLLYRLTHHFKPDVVVELGTSMAISTAYFSLACNKVISIEGCPNIFQKANENIQQLNLQNIQLINANFDHVLAPVLEKHKHQKILLYIDGNHRKNATLNYFYLALKNVSEDSIIIFDDIHWSKEMEEAWEIIKQNPQVTVSIDLFQIGIIFFHKTQVKENFIIWF